ncbi:hypothetical protein [Massilia haematophila]|uniref:Uncharacterized protein n=1 Tax=Massilia haematophila TaxID=457923 RepID=A0ABV7PQG2_9BURK
MAVARSQPALDKLRAYKQHISRVVADSQVDFARVAQQHVQETARTTRQLADQVERTAAEETDRSMRHQEESLKNFRDPFEHAGTQHNDGGTNHSTALHGTMQATGDEAGASAHIQMDGERASFQGNMQGRQAPQGNQSSTKVGKPA